LKIVEGTTTLCVGQFHSTVNTKLWKCGIITHKWHFLIEILRDIFKEPPVICYRKGKSLKYVLVKAKQRLWATHELADSFVMKSTPDSTMIATGLISSIICMTELSNKPKVACTQLKGPYWVISSRFIPN